MNQQTTLSLKNSSGNFTKSSFVFNGIDTAYSQSIYNDLVTRKILDNAGLLSSTRSSIMSVDIGFIAKASDNQKEITVSFAKNVLSKGNSFNSQSFIWALIDETNSRIIYNNLINNGIIGADNRIKYSLTADKVFNKDQYPDKQETLTAYVFNMLTNQVNEKSFPYINIDKNGSNNIYNSLIQSAYLDKNGFLDSDFDSTWDLTFLSPESYTPDQENTFIGAIRDILSTTSKYNENSFISNPIDDALSSSIYQNLITHEILDKNGNLASSFNDSTDLTFLFPATTYTPDQQQKNVFVTRYILTKKIGE